MDFETQVFTMAQQLGDSGGREFDTVDYIASELQVSTDEVAEVFANRTVTLRLEKA